MIAMHHAEVARITAGAVFVLLAGFLVWRRTRR
jgi:hypothetical protein